jgi:hypothetical protein
MKKLYFILISICLLPSCSNDSSTNDPNPNLLQRVDFYPGLTFERRWFFNSDGLLNEITKADGTIVQNFTYDSNNRLTSSTLFNDNGVNETHTFTYGSNDIVTTVDGEVVNYDSALNAHYTGDLNQSYRITKINNEKLIVEGKTAYMDYDADIGYFEVSLNEIFVNYSNNNNILYISPNESCNSFTYDNNSNPIRNATLAICRAFSYIENSRWVNGQNNSANNPLSKNYCSEDPESEVYQYTYNSNNLPITQTRDNYYQGVYENTLSSVKYYYQGDVIP